MSIQVSVGFMIPANVVEVGNEITSDQLAAITSASTPTSANPFLTLAGGGSYLPVTGGTLTGAVVVTQINNTLNNDIVIDAYNDSGAGTHYLHSFSAYGGTFNLATNGGGLTFPDATVQTTAGYPNTNPSGYISSAPPAQPLLRTCSFGSQPLDETDNYYIFVLDNSETLTLNDDSVNNPPIGSAFTILFIASTAGYVSCDSGVTLNGGSGTSFMGGAVKTLIKTAANTWWIG